MPPPRSRLTIRSLCLFTLLFALDLAGIAWVIQGIQAYNFRAGSLFGGEDDWRAAQEELAWALDPVREVTRPVVVVGLVLLVVALILWMVPRPLNRVLAVCLFVVFSLG